MLSAQQSKLPGQVARIRTGGRDERELGVSLSLAGLKAGGSRGEIE
jgi:hypothetical protein